MRKSHLYDLREAAARARDASTGASGAADRGETLREPDSKPPVDLRETAAQWIMEEMEPEADDTPAFTVSSFRIPRPPQYCPPLTDPARSARRVTDISHARGEVTWHSDPVETPVRLFDGVRVAHKPMQIEIARVYGIPVVTDETAPPGTITLRSVADGNTFRFTPAELDEIMPGWRATLAAADGWPARDALPTAEPDCG